MQSPGTRSNTVRVGRKGKCFSTRLFSPADQRPNEGREGEADACAADETLTKTFSPAGRPAGNNAAQVVSRRPLKVALYLPGASETDALVQYNIPRDVGRAPKCQSGSIPAE